MARSTADTAQITFRLPLDWLERADAVAAGLALAGRPMGRTDGVRALIAAGLFLYEPEVAQLADRAAHALTARSGTTVTREAALKIALKAALEVYVASLPEPKRKSATKRSPKKK